MSYPYSASNRLDEPHNYMYAPFQGVELLQSYLAGRLQVMRRPSEGHEAAELDQALLNASSPALSEDRTILDDMVDQVLALPVALKALNA